MCYEMEDFFPSKLRKTLGNAASHSIRPEWAITLLWNPQKPYTYCVMSRLYGKTLSVWFNDDFCEYGIETFGLIERLSLALE